MYPDNAVGPVAKLAGVVDDLLDLDTRTLTDDELASAVVALHREAGRSPPH